MSGFTPGPWRVEDGTALIWGDCDRDDRSSYGMGVPVAEARLTAPHWYGVQRGARELPGEANARLIAAAPELLEVARLALKIDDEWKALSMDERSRVEAAIAKAEGS